MFNLKEFQNDLVLEPIVVKLNIFLSKNKTQKVIKVIEELESLLDQSEHTVPITYILSILAEHDTDLITERIIQKVEIFLPKSVFLNIPMLLEYQEMKHNQ